MRLASKDGETNFIFVALFSFFLFTVFFSLVYLTSHYRSSKKLVAPRKGLSAPLYSPPNLKNRLFGILISSLKPSLRDQLEAFLKEEKGFYGIAVKDLRDGEVTEIHGRETFYMASLYKLLVMYSLFDEAEKGRLSLEAKIGNSTFIEAARSMITLSDNLAGETLGSFLGWEKIEANARVLGLEKTHLGSDLTSTPHDVALFLTKLARGELVSEDASARMILLLQGQKIRKRLPKYLPEGTRVANKTGEFDLFRHDAGIVYFPDGGSYVIVVMAKDAPSDEATSETIALISKIVFDYLSQKH